MRARGQKTREGAASAVRNRHDHRHRGQLLETQELFAADKRPGEKCGLEQLPRFRRRQGVGRESGTSRRSYGYSSLILQWVSTTSRTCGRLKAGPVPRIRRAPPLPSVTHTDRLESIMFVERIQVRHADPGEVLPVSGHDHQISFECCGGDQSIHRRNGVACTEPAPSVRDVSIDCDDPVAELDRRSP